MCPAKQQSTQVQLLLAKLCARTRDEQCACDLETVSNRRYGIRIRNTGYGTDLKHTNAGYRIRDTECGMNLKAINMGYGYGIRDAEKVSKSLTQHCSHLIFAGYRYGMQCSSQDMLC